MSDDLLALLETLFSTTWFTIGGSPVNAGRLLGLAGILFAVWWMGLLVERALKRFAQGRKTLSESGAYALGRIARYLVWIVGTVMGLDYLGFDIASLALIGGAVGVGIGLGLQGIVNNFLSGIIILVEKTLKVGDFVDLQSGVVGRVTEIGMRYTRVTTNDSVDIIVPNAEFVNGRVTNWTLTEASRRIHIPFGVSYGSDKEQVREAGIEAARAVAGTLDEDKRRPTVWLVGFGASSLDFELVVWVGPELATSPSATQAKYLWAIHTELSKRGIEIPFPQRDLHLRSGTVDLRFGDQKGSLQLSPPA